MPVHLLSQPTVTPFDPTALNAAIQTLRDNEAADDATVVALDKIVKAIAVPDIKPLTDRITALEGKTAPAQVIKVSGPPSDGDWDIAIDCRKTATKRETRLWVQAEPGLAIPVTFREDTITTPTHATASLQPDGSYQQEIGDLKLNYRTTLNAQNEASMAMTFPSGLITRVDLEGQDAQGTALELGGQAIDASATNVTLNPFMGNALVVQILFKFTYKDGSVANYLVPLTR